MNPSTERPPSRFIRGRARGGGPYRPYFYFRRNGRTIPARQGGGAAAEGGGDNRGAGTGNSTGAGRGRGRRSGLGQPAAQAGDASFLRPIHYAAPEDALQVQSVAIDMLSPCPGWSLYFPTERYQEGTEMTKRLKLLEAHYNNNPAHYDLQHIQHVCYFVVQARILMADESVTSAWPSLLTDLTARPLRTVATLGLAMHTALSLAGIAPTEAMPTPQTSTARFYVPRHTQRSRKIYARPIGFQPIGLLSHISSAHLDRLYCVRGSVSAVGAVEMAASWVTYKCSRCKQEQSVRQNGYYACRPFACRRDGCLAKKAFVEQRCSPHTRLRPMQMMRLAEDHLSAMVEAIAVSANETAECIDIELRHDLVDAVTCGQDCIVTGVLKMRPLVQEQEYQRNGLHSSSKRGPAETYLKVLSITDAKVAGHGLSESDVDAIAAVNGDQDSFKVLVQSLAPEIHGQEMVKAGLLLSLFGGAGSQLHDSDEINVLLVGDPGIGKSRLLQMCAQVSERGSLLLNNKRTGGAASQLTALIQGRTHYSVNAGALLASRQGHCAIDDIDRLASQQDTLLQAMQTKMCTLPSPTLLFSIATPTSIIATANSMRGHYDHSKTLLENIKITPSLLAQFHLVFVLRDRPNKDMDSAWSEHVQALHAGSKKSAVIAARYDTKPKANSSMSLAGDHTHRSSEDNYDLGERLRMSVGPLGEDEIDLVPTTLIKKFVLYARKQVRPLLTDDAIEAIRQFYVELRQEKNTERCEIITTSQLEGLIRLTQARARLDFSTEASKAHVRDVLCIVRHSMADTSVGDFVDTNPAGALGTPNSRGSGSVKKFLQMLQSRSSAMSRRIFDFDELKDMARHAGISCGVTNLVDVVNMQGYLLKKGPNLYEVMMD